MRHEQWERALLGAGSRILDHFIYAERMRGRRGIAGFQSLSPKEAPDLWPEDALFAASVSLSPQYLEDSPPGFISANDFEELERKSQRLLRVKNDPLRGWSGKEGILEGQKITEADALECCVFIVISMDAMERVKVSMIWKGGEGLKRLPVAEVPLSRLDNAPGRRELALRVARRLENREDEGKTAYFARAFGESLRNLGVRLLVGEPAKTDFGEIGVIRILPEDAALLPFIGKEELECLEFLGICARIAGVLRKAPSFCQPPAMKYLDACFRISFPDANPNLMPSLLTPECLAVWLSAPLAPDLLEDALPGLCLMACLPSDQGPDKPETPEFTAEILIWRDADGSFGAGFRPFAPGRQAMPDGREATGFPMPPLEVSRDYLDFLQYAARGGISDFPGKFLLQPNERREIPGSFLKMARLFIDLRKHYLARIPEEPN